MTGEAAFADYDEGMEMLMPEWFDVDFIKAVVDVAARLTDPKPLYDPRPAATAKALAHRLRAGQPL
jgi:hypothetical protein